MLSEYIKLLLLFGYRATKEEQAQDGVQLFEGQWYNPLYGVHTLETVLSKHGKHELITWEYLLEKPREPQVFQDGLNTRHDMRCPVLPGKYAVLNMKNGVFCPSYTAQAQGWFLVKATTAFQRLLLRFFFKESL